LNQRAIPARAAEPKEEYEETLSQGSHPGPRGGAGMGRNTEKQRRKSLF